MSDKKEVKNVEINPDPELDELLDSALEDLTKKPAANNKEDTVEEVTENTEDVNWTQDFMQQASQAFESNMAALFQNLGADVSPESLQDNFQRIAEAAAQVGNPANPISAPENPDFASTISQTLQNLSLGSENLQNPFNESEILNLLGGGGGGVGGGANQFLPIMQTMMQSLLSKDVLYPSLKDILERYPSWLAENRSNLPEADVTRYENQIKLMTDVCGELEGENESDPDAEKKERFDRVLVLMQKMQEYGQPPAEVVGEPLTPGLQFDTQGNPVMPADLDPSQCTLS